MEVAKMDEYISKQAFKEKYLCCGWLPEMSEKEFDDLPAAEVAEVRHGRWFFKYPNGWACSRCGEWGLMIDNRGIYKSSYCPNCGARMGKEANHGN